MRVPVSEAKAQLTDLVRRAEAGEDIVLTRHNREAVRLTPVRPALSPEKKRKIIQRIRESAAKNATEGPSAERSQDFLYDEDGLFG